VLDDQSISGMNLRCNDNHHFADANMDGVFQSAEVTTPIECGSKGTAAAGPPASPPGKKP
jgi:hypothetical protein